MRGLWSCGRRPGRHANNPTLLIPDRSPARSRCGNSCRDARRRWSGSGCWRSPRRSHSRWRPGRSGSQPEQRHRRRGPQPARAPRCDVADLTMQIIGLGVIALLFPPLIWALRLMRFHLFDRGALKLGLWVVGVVATAAVASALPATPAGRCRPAWAASIGDGLLFGTRNLVGIAGSALGGLVGLLYAGIAILAVTAACGLRLRTDEDPRSLTATTEPTAARAETEEATATTSPASPSSCRLARPWRHGSIKGGDPAPPAAPAGTGRQRRLAPLRRARAAYAANRSSAKLAARAAPAGLRTPSRCPGPARRPAAGRRLGPMAISTRMPEPQDLRDRQRRPRVAAPAPRSEARQAPRQAKPSPPCSTGTTSSCRR